MPCKHPVNIVAASGILASLKKLNLPEARLQIAALFDE